MLRLYHFSLSPFSRKVRLSLAEKRIEVELVEERYWELAGSCGLFLAAVGGSALVASLSFWFIFGCLIVSTAGFIAFWMCPGPESS